MAAKVDREAALKTATGRLFFAEYICSVPYMHFHNENFLANTGMLVSGDPALDAYQPHDRVHTARSPAILAKYIEEDIVIKDLSKEDAAKICDDIDEYMNERKYEAKHGFDTSQISLKWVELFDQLRQALEPLASEHRALKPSKPKPKFNIPGLTSPISREPEAVPEKQQEQSVAAIKPVQHPATVIIQEALQRRGLRPGE